MQIDKIEVWRPIRDYEGLYEVSSQGKIKRIKHKNKRGWFYGEKILTLRKDKGGYIRTDLYDNQSHKKSLLVHRLVAQAFIINPLNLPEVNHIDENLDNNSVSNLEWCTSSYNYEYGTRLARTVEKALKPIIAIDVNTGRERHFNSVQEASRQIGCKPHSISQVLTDTTGRHQTVYGYTYRYAHDENSHRNTCYTTKPIFMCKEKRYAENERMGNYQFSGRS